MSQEDKNAWQRAYRKLTGNLCTRKYEKTPRGFLMRTYRNMLSRVRGIQKKKAHLYQGLPILPKDEFYKWSINNADFLRLYKDWMASNNERKICPSINRIDSTKGYLLGNMEWITHSDNSKRITRILKGEVLWLN